MSNVASLELCRELYELSGWIEQTFWHVNYFDNTSNGNWKIETQARHPLPLEASSVNVPAYDLGFILRKLPPYLNEDVQQVYLFLGSDSDRLWRSDYHNLYKKTLYHVIADTPENAVCQLAINLFKQNILKREATA